MNEPDFLSNYRVHYYRRGYVSCTHNATGESGIITYEGLKGARKYNPDMIDYDSFNRSTHLR